MAKKERNLYLPVQKFLKKRFHCFVVKREKGTETIGKPDVIGIRNIGGDLYNDPEIITVEAKRTHHNFGKKAGQALGYSLFAHRCYLAINEKFEAEHKILASKLGIGLIEIGIDGKCTEVLTSPRYEPNEYMMLTLVYNIGYVRCMLCGGLKEKVWSKKIDGALKKRISYGMERKMPKMTMYQESLKKKKSKKQWFFLCTDCLKAIAVKK